MKKIDTIKKEKLFDGLEDDFLKSQFKFDNIQFKGIDFYDNPLRDLKKKLDEFHFDIIVKDGGFTSNSDFIATYKSIERLDVHFLTVEDKIYIFSFGEYQPARYILYIESVWEL